MDDLESQACPTTRPDTKIIKSTEKKATWLSGRDSSKSQESHQEYEVPIDEYIVCGCINLDSALILVVALEIVDFIIYSCAFFSMVVTKDYRKSRLLNKVEGIQEDSTVTMVGIMVGLNCIVYILSMR